MIKLKENVKLAEIKNTDNEEDIILSFNKMPDITSYYCIVAPKNIFDIIFMFNGLFDIDDIKSPKINEFFNHKLIEETEDFFPDHYTQAKNLSGYTVHFPMISNINIMIATLLQKLKVKSVFYNDGIITQNDMNSNIYFEHDDIGKSVSTVLRNINFVSYPFEETVLKENIDIIVNSDCTNWVNSDKCIVINTWNYKYIQFDNFKLFGDKVAISDDLKTLIENYSLAIRAIDDMIYSIQGIYT